MVGKAGVVIRASFRVRFVLGWQRKVLMCWVGCDPPGCHKYTFVAHHFFVQDSRVPVKYGFLSLGDWLHGRTRFTDFNPAFPMKNY